MRNLILMLLLIFSAIQLATAQKINLTYKLRSVDSLYVITDKAFSDEIIQTKFDTIFPNIIPNKNIISIEDNLNRRFDRIKFKNTNYYPKLLNEGYYNLYELEINSNPIYLVCSKNDTVVLVKNDTIVDNYITQDLKYKNKLVFLCKDYPELWKDAGRVRFGKKDLQKFISVLNEKHGSNNIRRQTNNKKNYLSFSIKGMAEKNKTDIMFGALMSSYLLDRSTNLSFKYGLLVNYYQKQEYFHKTLKALDSRDPETYSYQYSEITSHKIISIPFSINYEITNSTLTPYFNLALAPTFFSSTIKRRNISEPNDSGLLILNGFAAVGVKLKLTDSFNILSECRGDMYKGLNLECGIEYFLKL